MRYLLIIILTLCMMACGNSGKAEASNATIAEPSSAKPTFNGDSAYAFVAQQVAFGPRVPGTKEAQRCAAWITSKLKQYGAFDVQEQRGQVKAYNGNTLDICNISGRFNPESNYRILLLSHWDSRPWADHDTNPANHYLPIDGANDGASGVGVILEMARQFALKQPRIGVDVLFVDAEDMGPHANDKIAIEDEDGWALGTQYWISNPTIPLEELKYAILLDMVGGKDATFAREYHSEYAAKPVNDMVWKAAGKTGSGKRFVDTLGGAVVDDHVYLLIAGLPAIDIIEASNPKTGTFPPTWHTINDNLENIDPSTLQAVGQTLIEIVY